MCVPIHYNYPMIKLLHFADAHIDIANYGAHDPRTGLPLRVMDFLKSLDTIVDTAIEEKVDLVIFAGDAYKDRSPAPTFQREWGRRIMRLSRAKIPTILLTGNHDIAPSQQCAHAIQEFDTLEEGDHMREKLLVALPEEEAMRDAVVRLNIFYPSDMEAQIDEGALREKGHLAFDFRTSRHPRSDIPALGG